MTINQTSSSSDLLQLLLQQARQNSQTASTSNSTSSTTQTAAAGISSSDSATISGPGQLFSELESLSKSDPSEFKKITASISQQLSAAAKNEKDPTQAKALNDLASNFQTASQSGKFSDLFPKSHGQAPPPPPATDDSSSSNPLTDILNKALKQIQTDLTATTN